MNLGPVLVEDLELYNTAPNYTKIVLPESVDVSTQEQSITMQAELYNGVEKEDKMSGVGKWSSQGFTIAKITERLNSPIPRHRRSNSHSQTECGRKTEYCMYRRV